MIKRELAENVKTVILACVGQLDQSVKAAIEGAPEELASIYRRLVGQVMGQLFTDILMPVYSAHPDLEPAGLKRVHHGTGPVLMPLETGAELMAASSSVSDTLRHLRTDLARISEEDVKSLTLAAQDALDILQDIQEFLRRVCPGVDDR